MSRRYEMVVTIEQYDKDKEDAVIDAAQGQWSSLKQWEEWPIGKRNTYITSAGEGNLTVDEGEDEFAERMARAVWEANGGVCEVEVRCIYLENIPHETYTFHHDEYDAMVGCSQNT